MITVTLYTTRCKQNHSSQHLHDDGEHIEHNQEIYLSYRLHLPKERRVIMSMMICDFEVRF